MYGKMMKGWMKHWDFMLLDLICLQVSYVLAYAIRHHSVFIWRQSIYRNVTFVFIATQLIVTFFNNSFKNILKRGYLREVAETLRHAVLVVLTVAFYLFAVQSGDEYSRITLVLTGVIYLVTSAAVRCVWKHHLIQKGQLGTGKRSLLICTCEDMLDSVVENIQARNYGLYRLTGIALLDSSRMGETMDEVPIVADADTVEEYVCRQWVDEVFINLPREMPLPEKMINDFIDMGVTVHIKLIRMAELSGQKRTVERLGNYTVLTTSINMVTYRQLFYKRALDILGGIVGCLFTIVLFVFIAPMIYIQSPGPIFFSQIRVGRNGKKFKIYKFRSMYLDAEKRKQELMEKNRVKDGMMFKLDHDPRIIGGDHGVGAFIRKFSIDEFPQFLNVLKGEMSLVGTRPPTVDEWEKYDLHHRSRLAIKPGITGMWQVSGRSSITDFEQVVKLDREYIAKWSMGLDVRILLKTVAVVLGKDGSM